VSFSLTSPREIYILPNQPASRAVFPISGRITSLHPYYNSLKSFSLLTGYQILGVNSTTMLLLQVIKSHYSKIDVVCFWLVFWEEGLPGPIHSRANRMRMRHNGQAALECFGDYQK